MLKFSDVVYRIYEATLSPEHWPKAMDAVAALSGSEGAFVCAKSATGRWEVDAHSPQLDAFIRVSRSEQWWQQNPWLERSVEVGYRAGDVYCDQDVIAEDEMDGSPYYTDFLPRVGLGWQMAAAIQSDLGVPTALVVQRAKAKGPYAPPEMNTLRLVSRHVEQSLRISSRFTGVRTELGSTAAAFDSLDRAAFVLDRQQRPLLINRPAQGLIGRYFTHDDGRLAPAQRHEQDAFGAAVQNAHATAPDDSATPQPTTVSAQDGSSRLVVWTLPVVGASADQLGLPATPDANAASAAPAGAPRDNADSKAHVLVLAQPLEQDRVIDPAVLRNTFNLTLGEARLAALLGAGHSLKDAASTLGITEGTARVVLKRVFQKLGVSRQAELVSKLVLFARHAG
ncbi:helix-turn-helix transcriptional regulator [Xanthobacter sp. V0B-10]|uniref:helix-turn-helix transcriptional regulator n=1 Tax=Xanthobacter albus TaxID=3119929 RepID=UPI003728E532